MPRNCTDSAAEFLRPHSIRAGSLAFLDPASKALRSLAVPFEFFLNCPCARAKRRISAEGMMRKVWYKQFVSFAGETRTREGGSTTRQVPDVSSHLRTKIF